MDTDESVGRRLRAYQRGTSTADALALFDALPAVGVPEVLGAWRGEGLLTRHPLDGLLESYGWHGKRFDGPDEAHPLVFGDARGTFSVDPVAVPLPVVLRTARLLHAQPVAAAAHRSLRLLRTRRPKARLRTVEHRGVATATLVYDALPVLDHFRAVDRDTLVGLMDARGLGRPFLFVLRREPPAPR